MILFIEGSSYSNGTPLQSSCLENPMDGGAWKAAVHGVAKSRTRLSDFTFTFHFHALEKEMATHSSVLAWRIPWMEKPGGLQSMGSHRVGHYWSDLARYSNLFSRFYTGFVMINLPQAFCFALFHWFGFIFQSLPLRMLFFLSFVDWSTERCYLAAAQVFYLPLYKSLKQNMYRLEIW